ncbi:MAG: antibiotic biosynthesis monooxygenase [Undibacterium sp.]|nr:antibiotic biosynthesis monooxygenase [Opitutaceae bacterium]
MSTQPGAITHTPEQPYHAVIFTSRRTDGDRGYDAMAARMVELGATQDGFLGIESARGADGLGITVSYWRDGAAILAWKRNAEHERAQAGGKAAWYAEYHVRIAKMERAYGGD